ncbi:MAG: PDZ domain-containing protein [Anaeromyxobacter sp.]|nr:PDZ domain-containing protein [Anaeromyxobacter sp.]MBL0275587.1 PDZ domain-containing protein [Anaeromyxobacter sp.]
MIRPFRLVATLSVALALVLGVAVRFVRADSAAHGAAQAAAPAPRPAPAVLASAGPAGLPDGALALKTAPGAARGQPGDEDYRLDRLPILGRVIHHVYHSYVDPTRIDPKAMVVSALDSVERTVAEVMVQGDDKSAALSVTVGAAQKEFPLKDVDTIWKARVLLGEVMGFVQEHLVAHQDLREIEYAAANGMLNTLDPHSVLLEPKYFKEMKLQTRGEFGGLGFVIAMRDGNLTVVKILKGTPAQRAGLKAKDVIAKIGEQSTVNMDLQDAVDRLRGKPGTSVAITVHRGAWPEPKRMSLQRETINVETVPQAKLLDGGVGYLRLSQFSRNGTRDLTRVINQQRLQAGGSLKGLILDLRGNPGGLLEEAIDLSDLFLAEGVIVKTVGDGAQRIRELKEATTDRDDLTALPLVVLVNNGSASASEIVAGALKNNGRALIVGRQTFGKGSVQSLFDFTEPGRPTEEAALKLTIAQYLTPGDVSIQEVGITPDVALLPGRALKDQINVFAPPRSMGEADLDRHLTNPGAKEKDAAAAAAAAKKQRAEKPALELRYLLEESEDGVAKALKREAAQGHADEDAISAEQAEDEAIDADPDQVKEDYQIRFSRELLLRAPFNDRARLLKEAAALVEEKQAEQEKKLEARLAQLGLDWSAGPARPTGAPRGVVTVTPAAGRPARAGETMAWTVTVENRGDAPFRRLRAWSTSDKNGLLDRREFVFGQVRPGEKRAWTVPVKLPRSMDSRRDEVVLHFDEANDKAPPDVAAAVDVVEVPRPLFALSVQVDDRKGGNGDGLPARGESFTLRVDVRNAGPGAAGEKTFVSLKNLGDEKLFIKKGREVLGALKPGEARAAAMEVELKHGSKLETLPIRLQVFDEKTGEFTSQKLELQVAPAAERVAEEQGAVRVEAAEARVRGGAAAGAPVVASARKGAVLPTTGALPGWRRVEWAKGRFGFVAAAEVVAARGPRGGAVAEAWQREPPRITLSPDPGKGAPVVEAETFRLTGSAMVPASADPDARLRDVYVFVNEEKAFFKVVPEGTAPDARLDFTADLPLKPGLNLVTVFAREDEEFQGRRSFSIFRKPPAAVAETTPAARPATRTP